VKTDILNVSQETLIRFKNRGGKGIKGMSLNEDDVIDQFISLSTQ